MAIGCDTIYKSSIPAFPWIIVKEMVPIFWTTKTQVISRTNEPKKVENPA